MPRPKYFHHTDFLNSDNGRRFLSEYIFRLSLISHLRIMLILKDGPMTKQQILDAHPLRKGKAGRRSVLPRDLERCIELGLISEVWHKQRKYYFSVDENVYRIMIGACSILAQAGETPVSSIEDFLHTLQTIKPSKT